MYGAKSAPAREPAAVIYRIFKFQFGIRMESVFHFPNRSRILPKTSSPGTPITSPDSSSANLRLETSNHLRSISGSTGFMLTSYKRVDNMSSVFNWQQENFNPLFQYFNMFRIRHISQSFRATVSTPTAPIPQPASRENPRLLRL